MGLQLSSYTYLTAFLDRNSAKVGGTVFLTLNYRLPDGARLSTDQEIKGIEELTVLEQVTGPGQIRIRLLVDQLGSWKTGPIILTYLDKEDKARTLTADPVSLTVLSNLGEKPEEAHPLRS